jgi:mRNA interferase RelE/StbE
LKGRVLYKSSVSHDLKRIDSRNVRRILDEIGSLLGSDPRAGEPLAGEFKGLFRLRVGDYRVIYALVGDDVLVLRVRHRGKAYE